MQSRTILLLPELPLYLLWAVVYSCCVVLYSCCLLSRVMSCGTRAMSCYLVLYSCCVVLPRFVLMLCCVVLVLCRVVLCCVMLSYVVTRVVFWTRFIVKCVKVSLQIFSKKISIAECSKLEFWSSIIVFNKYGPR